MIRFDEKMAIEKVYDHYAQDTQHKELELEFMQLAQKTIGFLDIEAAVTAMETRAVEVSYSKGFSDGMQLVLMAMAGQNVITFNQE